MNKYTIAVKKFRGLYVTPYADATRELNTSAVHTMNADMIQLGYVMSEDVFNVLVTYPKAELKNIHERVIKALQKIVGADVVYNPMYPNFPEQVMEASDEELFVNAIMHYWSTYGQGDLDNGGWLPQYTKEARPFFPEDTNIETLRLVSKGEFEGLFTKIMASNDSISSEDKKIVEYFLSTKENDIVMPREIPYKENLCMIAGDMIRKNRPINDLVTNTTDVLRIATYLSDGDVSLGTNTKFKSFPRAQREVLIKALDKVAREEDFMRHAEKWNKLLHGLHVGDYSDRLWNMAKAVRENVKVKTFNGKIEAMLNDGKVREAIRALTDRPTELARRLDSLLRSYPDQSSAILDAFRGVASEVPTRVLFQMGGHFRGRGDNATENRVFFPKGSVAKAVSIQEYIAPLPHRTVDTILNVINNVLLERFGELESLGNVYVDPRLKFAPIPQGQRSASTQKKTYARGTRVPFGNEDQNTIRMFIYWKGRDVDLSALFLDENFDHVDLVSYQNLREYYARHSGDITSAPQGASEFVDVDIQKAKQHKIRYVVMDVRSYSGEQFSDIDTCYAGWMMRENPQSNETYTPKTVENKFDMAQESRTVLPVVFDLETREVIWLDLVGGSNTFRGGNNLSGNRASTKEVAKAIVNMSKPTLYDLFFIHGSSRGNIVDTKEEADIVFGLFEGDLLASDVTEINTEYMVG